MIDWEPNQPTIEDDIRMNSGLSAVQKELRLKQSRLQTWRQAFGAVLVLLLAGALGALTSGWTREILIVAVVGGSLITYTLLEEADKGIESQLRDEEERLRAEKRESRRQARAGKRRMEER